jgi:hypothetical protein
VSIENEGSGGQLQRNLAKLRQLGDLTLKKMNARRQKLLVVRLLAAKSLLATGKSSILGIDRKIKSLRICRSPAESHTGKLAESGQPLTTSFGYF